MPQELVYVDLDDFHEDNTSLELLEDIKREIPGFKVTLFTVVGRCSNIFIDHIKTFDWIDMGLHGYLHKTSRECEMWDYFKSISYLKYCEQFKLSKLFKAPGWQISDGMYEALNDEGYTVADQIYNNARRPATLKVYLLDSLNKVHGHIGHMGGFNQNELSLIKADILKFKDREFGFIKDGV